MDKQTFINKVTELQANYQPNSAVKAHLARVDLIAVVGATGVGKTSIMMQSGVPYVPSDVTRPIREGEKNGVDCNFRNDYDRIKARQFSLGSDIIYEFVRN